MEYEYVPRSTMQHEFVLRRVCVHYGVRAYTMEYEFVLQSARYGVLVRQSASLYHGVRVCTAEYWSVLRSTSLRYTPPSKDTQACEPHGEPLSAFSI